MGRTNVRKHMRRTPKGRMTTVTRHSRSLKNMSYPQLQRHNINLKPTGDADNDGVINMKDCRPLNKKEQGIIHALIKKKEELVKKRAKKLEAKQDKLLKKIDAEAGQLQQKRKVMVQINKNLLLKRQLKALKQANFRATRTGRIVAFVRDPETGKKVSKGFNKLFKEINKLG